MKNLLFPRQFQLIGWVLFIPAFIMGALVFFSLCSFQGVVGTLINDIIIIGVALGSIFIVCSKEKQEDEMTSSIRLASLLNALYIYVIILIGSTLLVNGMAYFRFMAFNLVLLPIIFVIIFRLEMQRYNMMSEDEE
ncbi:MAG: hypothetical protein K2H47_10145 [Muribaculaceae bacterium]|nr:hypothetical protein [Muribaculaceae bacterium]